MSYQEPPKHLKWQMPDAQDDLDTADSSHAADEFESVPSASSHPPWITSEEAANYGDIEPDWQKQFEAKEQDSKSVADARCSRRTEGDDYALLISGMDEALLKLAGGIIYESNEALRDAFGDLMAVRQAMTEAL